MISEYGIECNLKENGMLEVALNEKHVRGLEKFRDHLKFFGLDSTLLRGEELETEIKSPRFIAGLNCPHGAILNPAKLAREMKRVVEEVGIEVRERTVVTRITPGKMNHVDTELGDIRAPILVIALNAHAHKLGFFKNRVFPISVFQIATEPLTETQLESIG
jgi:glycine/D-amino acid oxidase-like deaminating enzyme